MSPKGKIAIISTGLLLLLVAFIASLDEQNPKPEIPPGKGIVAATPEQVLGWGRERLGQFFWLGEAPPGEEIRVDKRRPQGTRALAIGYINSTTKNSLNFKKLVQTFPQARAQTEKFEREIARQAQTRRDAPEWRAYLMPGRKYRYRVVILFPTQSSEPLAGRLIIRDGSDPLEVLSRLDFVG